MQTTTMVSAEFSVSWRSGDAVHRDSRFFPKIDFWRDFTPADLGERMRSSHGELIEVDINLAGGIETPDSRWRGALRRSTVEEAFQRRHLHGPFQGRFYPRGVLARVSGAGTLYDEDLRPFRVLSMDPERVNVDLRHPLEMYALAVGGRICDRLASNEERGGSCNDVLADLTQGGPGMQCLPPDGTVDFVQADSFLRDDPSPDERFYFQPRMVHHIDTKARTFINRIYRRFIGPDDKVLDLMSSWASHLDGIAPPAKVTGLGMNGQELAANDQLDDFLVHDLNREPHLPWDDGQFDVAICTVSVEYLVKPYSVFAEVARVLRPGGLFVVTFSDRWFPPKAIRLWNRLHPFERMGLVLDYFRRTDAFTGLGTESKIGWPRPADDQYYGKLLDSDPVFAVWGERVAAGQQGVGASQS